MLSLLMVLSTMAHAATPVHPGELAGSLSNGGYTLPARELRLQIFSPSSYALNDQVELQSSVLGLLAGPNLAAEVGLLHTEGQALSLTPSAAIGWTGTAPSLGLRAAYTLGGMTSGRLNLGIGGGWTGGTAAAGVTTAVSVGYEIPLHEYSLLQLSAQVDPLNSIQQTDFQGSIGAGYIHGWEHYRLEAGLLVLETAAIQDQLDDAGLALELPAYLPAPYVLMWWRI